MGRSFITAAERQQILASVLRVAESKNEAPCLSEGMAAQEITNAALISLEVMRSHDDLVITKALEHARLALSSTHNCLTTDRPDLPRAPDTGWTTDFNKEIALIDKALAVLGFSSCSDRRCGICRTAPSSARDEAHRREVPTGRS